MKSAGMTLLFSLLSAGCEFPSQGTVLTRLGEPVSPSTPIAGMPGVELPKSTDAGTSQPLEPGVDPERMYVLSRGLSAHRWISEGYQENFYSYTELERFKAFGIRHLRVPFGVDLLFDPDDPGNLIDAYRDQYDTVLDQILQHDLAVIVHPFKTESWWWTDSSALGKLVAFWQAFAQHLRDRDPDRVFIKVGYDPSADAPGDWYRVQAELLRAVREVDPERTLIATPNTYSYAGVRHQLHSVVEVPVSDDRNVAYDFGFFQPTVLAHQGAYWREPWLEPLHDLPYPATAAECNEVLPSIDDADAREHAQAYCDAGFDRTQLLGLLAPVRQWADEHALDLISVMGIYRPYIDDLSRLSWLRDARTVLEEQKVSWTSYEDGPEAFSVLTGTPGDRTIGELEAQALGLETTN